MPAHVADLSPDFNFLFHLGNLQYALEDQCREGAYKEARGQRHPPEESRYRLCPLGGQRPERLPQKRLR